MKNKFFNRSLITEKRFSILVIDDEQANVNLLGKILAEKGYEVRPATNPNFALQSSLSKPPDLILLDVKMPELDGFTFCRKLKEDPRTSGIPIIFVSALHDAKDKIKAFNVGGVDYLTKPFHDAEVLVRVQTQLELQQMRTKLESLVQERTVALRNSEERFRDFVENTTNLITRVDRNGNIIYVNHVAQKVFGMPPDKCIGLSAFYFIDKRDRKRTEEWFDRCVKNRLNNSIIENRQVSRNGKISDMVWTVSFHYDKDARVKHINSIAQDITEQKKLKHRLQQAQKMEAIGNLAGGIAHDFNNLLFPIIGMSEMLLEDLPEDSLEYENAEEIYHAGKRAGDLVNQILAFSRQAEHKMTPVRVQNVLKEVLKLSRSTIPSNIEIHENIQQDCGLIMADPTQIHQIAMNLITNALHAIGAKNGVIDIELEEIAIQENELPDNEILAGEYVRLSVSDNGTGMPQSAINKIFEPYFTTKKKGKGTGLGLAVVYGIVKEHNGNIKVYSEVGEGSTFNIYLPLMKKNSKIATTDPVTDIKTGTERILLVDDEKSVAKLESKMLSRLGYKVTEKTKSPEALNIFKMNPENFDLVITDMTMPDMTGDQLAKKIFSIKPDIPIVICTGFSERINKEQAKIIGVKGFLMKPVVKADMADMVRNVLDEAEKDSKFEE
ncbi:MAG: response regulator [Desulfobacteraceae bacterium]|nr:response regulator [Desulfobacteraceae bacterium]